jgi:Secretion system C-terminal sorting domain
LIDIPKWDFNWQGNYNYQQPIVIPGGSKLWAIAHYDNTTANPFNPNSPPLDVSKGEATTDEMMLVYFTYTASQTNDENIIVDTNSHSAHYLNCDANAITSIANLAHENKFLLHPNPSHGNFKISFDNANAMQLQLIDAQGRIVYLQNNYTANSNINVSELPKGIYLVTLKNKNNIQFRNRLRID